MGDYTIKDIPFRYCECCGAMLLRGYPDDKTCGSCDLIIDTLQNSLNKDKNRVWSYGEGLRSLTPREKKVAKYLSIELRN